MEPSIVQPQLTAPIIHMSISTWAKDSHGLYDYDAQPQYYKKQDHKLNDSCRVYKNIQDEVTFIKMPKDRRRNHENYCLVSEICIDRSKNTPVFKLKSDKILQKQNQYFNVVRTAFTVVNGQHENINDLGYALKPGNIIKLGRMGYMVLEIKNKTQVFSLRDTSHFQGTSGIIEVNEKTKAKTDSSVTCKVCLCEEQSDSDPLISPCKCKGSCSVIHVGCLKLWINSKVKKDLMGIATSYNFTKFECEICKFPFPQLVKVKNIQIQMMTINKPDQPYIILESLNNNNESKEEKSLHLISTFENKAVHIGRGHQCEIRVTDISVSRSHAEIVLHRDKFYIKDTKSKFGTLIRMDDQIVLSHSKPVKIQFGRTLYEFRIQGEISEEVDTE